MYNKGDTLINAISGHRATVISSQHVMNTDGEWIECVTVSMNTHLGVVQKQLPAATFEPAEADT